MTATKRFDAPTAAATFTASQRPRRDARLLHDGGHGAGGLVADVKLDCTSQLSHSVNEISNTEFDISYSISQISNTASDISHVDSEWEDARKRNASQPTRCQRLQARSSRYSTHLYRTVPYSKVARVTVGQGELRRCSATHGDVRCGGNVVRCGRLAAQAGYYCEI